MATNNKNIIVGAAAFFVSTKTSADATIATDVALPTTLTAGTVAVDAVADLRAANTVWTEVGFTQEGVEVSYEPDFGEVEVDQLLDSARLFKQSMRVTVNTTLAEATLENLLIVWGQKNSSLSGTVAKALDIEGGALGDEPIERALAFVGPAPRITSSPAQRIYHVNRAIQTESSSHALRRSENTSFPVSFRLLPGDILGTAGVTKYGVVRDRAKL